MAPLKSTKSKKPSKCKHDGDVFPLREEASLHKDPIIGWVVDVRCGKCNETGVTRVDCRPKTVDWDDPIRPDDDDPNEEMARRYGPFKEIGRDREKKLIELDKWQHILTIKGCDSDEHDDGFLLYAHVGHGLVDVQTILESTNPMPEGLEINDFWFDDFVKAP